MSQAKQSWWHPSKLPPNGYQLNNNLEKSNHTSFYPFNSELGYKVFKRIIEMKRINAEKQNNHVDLYHLSDYVQSFNNNDNYLLLNKQNVDLTKSLPSTSSNCTLNQFVFNEKNTPGFHLTLKCDLDDIENC
ncbi:unnamed protein product [Schistosoma turkestanicum]|nr:unnamed protein product [Schistosoma turkestanicum]